MYRSLYVPLDNSEHANTAMRLGLALASDSGARIAGSHVYAAALHDVRFKQMEFTLPDEYKEETELEKQRRIHDGLIARGLRLISDSYLEPMRRRAEEAGVAYKGKTFDGKNFERLVHDISESDYDLVLMGALGLGAVEPSSAGSVCERVLRRIRVDTLVVRRPEDDTLRGHAPVLCGLDGSSWSWGAFRAAVHLAEATGRRLDLVAVHPPGAGGEDLLDAHLALGRRIARHRGVAGATTAADGDVTTSLMNLLECASPWLVAVGRHGIDADDERPELGSVVEHLVRHAPCNLLIAARAWRPEAAAGPVTRVA